LQRRCLDRGVFCSLDELTTALGNWIKTWNATARAFKWTKTADQIVDRICRYCSRISGPAHRTASARPSLVITPQAPGLGSFPPRAGGLLTAAAFAGASSC
jgi:hypothetical protein